MLRELQHAGKVRLYELLLQQYGEEGLAEGEAAPPSVAALRQKVAVKEVKKVRRRWCDVTTACVCVVCEAGRGDAVWCLAARVVVLAGRWRAGCTAAGAWLDLQVKDKSTVYGTQQTLQLSLGVGDLCLCALSVRCRYTRPSMASRAEERCQTRAGT